MLAGLGKRTVRMRDKKIQSHSEKHSNIIDYLKAISFFILMRWLLVYI